MAVPLVTFDNKVSHAYDTPTNYLQMLKEPQDAIVGAGQLPYHLLASPSFIRNVTGSKLASANAVFAYLASGPLDITRMVDLPEIAPQM